MAEFYNDILSSSDDENDEPQFIEDHEYIEIGLPYALTSLTGYSLSKPPKTKKKKKRTPFMFSTCKTE